MTEGEEVKYRSLWILYYKKEFIFILLYLIILKCIGRKPSVFRRKASEAHMISATLLQDEDELKKKPSKEDDRKSRISESKSSSTISLKDMKKPMTEQCKRDILHHLDNLIKSVEWLALLSQRLIIIIAQLPIIIYFNYFSFLIDSYAFLTLLM